jgi:hypothetical protein
MFRKIGLLSAAGAACLSMAVLSSLPANAARAQSRVATVQSRAGGGFTTVSQSGADPSGNAGYIGNLPGRDTVSFHLSVPQADCTRNVDAPIFIQAFLNGMLKDGTFSASGMYIGVSCTGNVASYQATLVSDDGNGAVLTVSPGDVLAFTGNVGIASEAYTLTDTTTSQTITGSGAGIKPQNLQLTAQGGFTGSPVFPGFRPPITYSMIRVNNANFSTTNPQAFYEVDGSNNTEIQTGALLGSGTAFQLTYVSNM